MLETVETGHRNRGDFHCMQMSLVMSMRYIFDDDCTNWRTKLITFWLFGSDVIFPASRHLTFAPHVHRIESCERCRAFPKRVGPRILSLECVHHFGTTDYFSGRKQEQSFEHCMQKSLVISMRFILFPAMIEMTRYHQVSLSFVYLHTLSNQSRNTSSKRYKKEISWRILDRR